METARTLVFCSSALQPTVGFIPLAMLQSLCGHLMKAAGAWPWSSPAESHHGLGLEQSVASSGTWIFSLCEGFQEVDWESVPTGFRGEMG